MRKLKNRRQAIVPLGCGDDANLVAREKVSMAAHSLAYVRLVRRSPQMVARVCRRRHLRRRQRRRQRQVPQAAR